VNDVLLAGPVQQLDSLGVRGLGLGSGGRADFPKSGAKLAPLSAVGGSASTALAHALGGGPDSGHGNLS
jgi:hypothetical protein